MGCASTLKNIIAVQFITQMTTIPYSLDPIRIYPKIRFAKEEGDTNFICESYGETTWSFNDSNLPSNAIAKGSQYLMISGVRILNEGDYECHGYNAKMEPFHATAFLHIISKCVRIVEVCIICFV